MKNTKHTPGPWYLARIQNISPVPIFAMGDLCVATTYSDQREGIDPIANAHLIAAAPEMFRALQAAQGALCEVGGREAVEALELVDAAIAKAEGE